jgi:hypothetical protein
MEFCISVCLGAIGSGDLNEISQAQNMMAQSLADQLRNAMEKDVIR